MNTLPYSDSRNATHKTALAAQPANAARVRLGAASLVVAGILFVLYPAIRPFSDEKSLQAAAAFASTEWLLSHMLGMLGFTLVGLGLLGLHSALRETSVERLAFRSLAVSWLGICLTLPYYGAEAFGLYAIGQEALSEHNVALEWRALRAGVCIVYSPVLRRTTDSRGPRCTGRHRLSVDRSQHVAAEQHANDTGVSLPLSAAAHQCDDWSATKERRFGEKRVILSLSSYI